MISGGKVDNLPIRFTFSTNVTFKKITPQFNLKSLQKFTLNNFPGGVHKGFRPIVYCLLSDLLSRFTCSEFTTVNSHQQHGRKYGW